jgi:hypothetical protein
MTSLMEYVLRRRPFKYRTERKSTTIIFLPSVGSGLMRNKLIVYPMNDDHSYDMDNGTELEDCDADWFDGLDDYDNNTILKHLEKLI